ncbi:MAG: alpha/beta hydrolase [Candidatus Thiodiazotropha sp.]|jgi:pimeloyl-ACP methyl ester carboxylesterase
MANLDFSQVNILLQQSDRLMKLVLLPGLDGTGQLFRWFLQRYPGEARVIPLPEDGPQDHRALAQRIRTQLPAEDFVLLAESYSGLIAVHLMAMGMTQVKGVIFVASFLKSPNPWLLRLGMVAPLERPPHGLIPNIIYRSLILGKQASDALIREFLQVITQLPPGLVKKRIRALKGLHAPSLEVDVPIFYLQAQQDRLISSDCWDDFKRRFPKAECYPMDGPHLLLQSQPKSASVLVAQLICKCETRNI